MRRAVYIWFGILTLIAFLILCCNRAEKKTEIPDIQEIFSNIDYLDSLLRSARIDSLEQVNLQLNNTLLTRQNQILSPDDRAILDSLNKISIITGNFLRFCTDTRSNLGMLKQELKSVEAQYESGKIKFGLYIASLLEGDQLLVDLQGQFYEGLYLSLLGLHNQSGLTDLLSPLPADAY